MRDAYRLRLLAASFSAFTSVGTAFARPACTPHHRLTRKVNATSKTQFHTNCVMPHSASWKGQ